MALAGATPGALAVLGWSRVPDGTPLARRSKQLYGVLGAFVTDVARRKAGLAEALRLTHRSEDKRLVKAQGPVWDQADRQHGHVPEKLRHLDTDARWSKRADQGWAMDATRSYHRFSQQADRPPILRARKTTLEPVFDLICNLLGRPAQPTQLPIQRLPKVRAGLTLAVLALHRIMLTNSIRGFA